MSDSSLFKNLFCIPHNGKFILYQPFLGIAFLTNPAFVNLLFKARLGEKQALEELDCDKTLINKLFEAEHAIAQKDCQKTHPEFKPVSVSLFLTNNCNLRCKYCYAEGGHNRTQMPWDMITSILDQVALNAIEKNTKKLVVNFHGGGDISAAWDLFVQTKEYLDVLCSKHNLDLFTSAGSNGILDATQREWFIRNINHATLSIDGTESIQNNQRPFPDGRPSFPTVDETLNAFDRANYPYAIRSTITSESVFHLEEIIRFFSGRYKIRKIKFEPMYPRGRAEKLELKAPDAVTFVEAFRKARKIAHENGIDLMYSGARLNALTHAFCQAAGNSCAVTPEGWITSCYEVLSTADPFSETFFYGRFNPESKKIDIDHVKRDKLFELSVTNKSFCDKCFCKWHCAGDCAVKSLHSEQITDTAALPDRCYINRELTKDQLIEAINS